MTAWFNTAGKSGRVTDMAGKPSPGHAVQGVIVPINLVDLFIMVLLDERATPHLSDRTGDRSGYAPGHPLSETQLRMQGHD
ncbi:hypothetical protein SZ63_10530 [Methanoculleus sediminis]|uniref:Uncharacterized protein n=1 Tax=Methanoculleus sediminis TaxID=1550566 RepID=A0A0H1QX23_9EURY|nr:hypothetical protein SZ63_10530 [Methanoculleus sediminis]